MGRSLTKGQLHDLLRQHGHAFSSAGRDDAPIDVCPPPETYLTVGLDADGTLKPAYRARYFACVRTANDEPRIQYAPAFALQGFFVAAARHQPSNNDFVSRPTRWLLARIKQFESVLLWPRSGFHGTDALDFLAKTMTDERIDQAPHLARWFERHAPELARVGAVWLSTSDPDDSQVIWEAANLVGVQGYDFYLSDPATQEVYLLHHHDKLVISIPDARTRQELMDELVCQSDLFEDCSGYRVETDEEFDE